jgi:hypothetical protein
VQSVHRQIQVYNTMKNLKFWAQGHHDMKQCSRTSTI